MIMRVLGALLILCALAFLAGDVWAWAGSGADFSLQPLGKWWSQIHLESLLLLQPAIERHISPALWDPGAQTLLEWPAAVEFGVLGLILVVLFRRRRPPPSKPAPLNFNRK